MTDAIDELGRRAAAEVRFSTNGIDISDALARVETSKRTGFRVSSLTPLRSSRLATIAAVALMAFGLAGTALVVSTQRTSGTASTSGASTRPVLTAEQDAARRDMAINSEASGSVYAVKATGVESDRAEIRLEAYTAAAPQSQGTKPAASISLATVSVSATGETDDLIILPPSLAGDTAGQPLVCGVDGVTCYLDLEYLPGSGVAGETPAPVPVLGDEG